MTQAIDVRPNSVAVLGFDEGSAGQVETWFEAATGYHIACFVHDAAAPPQVDATAENRKRVSQRMEYPTSDSFKGRPLISSTEWVARLMALGVRRVLPLTSDNRTRLSQIEQCERRGIELVSAIHPTVTILSGATIEPGVWINAGTIVSYKAEIAAGVLINTAARIDHHNVLERCCQVFPGTTTAGHVTLRECCYVYMGAVVINRIEIGADAVVGAGAVVLRDVPPRSTAVGVPARVITRR